MVQAIAAHIAQLKREAYPNLSYLILVGSHEVIPMKPRANDNPIPAAEGTNMDALGDEAFWARKYLPAGPLQTMLQSERGGYYLTDSAYSSLADVNDGWGRDGELVSVNPAQRIAHRRDQIRATAHRLGDENIGARRGG